MEKELQKEVERLRKEIADINVLRIERDEILRQKEGLELDVERLSRNIFLKDIELVNTIEKIEEAKRARSEALDKREQDMKEKIKEATKVMEEVISAEKGLEIQKQELETQEQALVAKKQELADKEAQLPIKRQEIEKMEKEKQEELRLAAEEKEKAKRESVKNDETAALLGKKAQDLTRKEQELLDRDRVLTNRESNLESNGKLMDLQEIALKRDRERLADAQKQLERDKFDHAQAATLCAGKIQENTKKEQELEEREKTVHLEEMRLKVLDKDLRQKAKELSFQNQLDG